MRSGWPDFSAAPMIEDTRQPVVVNPELRIMQSVDAETGATLGTLVQWDNHPETIWSRNLMILKPPHTYGYERRPYGEINSLGPETAPILHAAMIEPMGGN
jgi:hypothetical protein